MNTESTKSTFDNGSVDDPLLTRRQAAEHICMCEKMIDNFRKRGLPYIQYATGGRVFIRQSALDAFMQQHQRG